jgi:prepilin peptidase CpaA
MENVPAQLAATTAMAYLLLLVAAAGWDLWRMIIPNALVVTLVALFPVAALAAPASGIPWWSHVGAGASVLLVGLAAYRFRVLGAGDVKLLATIGLWAGFAFLPMVLLVTVLAGGALAILMIVIRRIAMALAVAFSGAETVEMPRVLLSGEKLPYGVAIAVGGATLMYGHPFF